MFAFLLGCSSSVALFDSADDGVNRDSATGFVSVSVSACYEVCETAWIPEAACDAMYAGREFTEMPTVEDCQADCDRATVALTSQGGETMQTLWPEGVLLMIDDYDCSTAIAACGDTPCSQNEQAYCTPPG